MMASAAILDLLIYVNWPFQRVGSVVLVFCTKFGSNICYYSVIVTEIDAFILQTLI